MSPAAAAIGQDIEPLAGGNLDHLAAAQPEPASARVGARVQDDGIDAQIALYVGQRVGHCLG